MKHLGNMPNERLLSQGEISKHGSRLPEEPNPERKVPEPSQQHGRPAPSRAPNEGRGNGYEHKGGRQSTGGIPNRDDQNDRDATSSFRGTADRDTSEDDANNGEHHSSTGQFRRDLISPIRSPD